MNFEYLKTESYMDSIEIDRIGQCSIEARNDLGECFYLHIETDLGWVMITKFGPIQEGIGIRNTFNLIHFEQDYDEKKLHKIIRDFINDPKRIITQVDELEYDDFKEIQKQAIEQLKEVL